jgi:hypothetical protein
MKKSSQTYLEPSSPGGQVLEERRDKQKKVAIMDEFSLKLQEKKWFLT